MRKRLIMATAAVWLLSTLAPAVAAPALHDTASMQTLPGLAEVEGSTVSLVATNDRATITVNTSDLAAGNAYTLWGSCSRIQRAALTAAGSMIRENVRDRSVSLFSRSLATQQVQMAISISAATLRL